MPTGEQDNLPLSLHQQSTPNVRPAWRNEPEIDAERKRFLAERLAIEPDIKQGIFPFKDIKLARADVEWLLANHEKGRGPVDWSDEHQRERLGLDLRGADLRHVDLRNLPLARMLGGLSRKKWQFATLVHTIINAHRLSVQASQ